MSLFRQVLTALLSIGLVLSPVAAANAAAASAVALMDQATSAAPSPMDGDCHCCDVHGKCAAALCSMGCVQLGPASDAAFELVLIGHAALSGIVPLVLQGLAWQPPTPPPRV